jgi:hypothetical protein
MLDGRSGCGAQSQVNLVVSRRQVEIEVVNPCEYIRTQMDIGKTAKK